MNINQYSGHFRWINPWNEFKYS